MNYSSGFQLIINTAWDLLSTVIVPAGSFGNEADITFLNIALLGVGGIFLVKFYRFCVGGNFNQFHDHYKDTAKRRIVEDRKIQDHIRRQRRLFRNE